MEEKDSIDLELELSETLKSGGNLLSLLPILTGSGSRSSQIFVSGAHSLVSLNTRTTM